MLLSAAQLADAAKGRLSDRVLVVVNGYESGSKKVAAHYMAVHGIPAANRCVVKPPDASEAGTRGVTWEDYQAELKPAIRKCLERAGKTKILYLVLSYLMPFRLEGRPRGSGVALDSYLSDIWDELPEPTRAQNPYYAAVQSKANIFPPFTPLADYRDRTQAPLIYAVWRLDGPSAQSATALVDKAMAAEATGARGIACFDGRNPDFKNGSDEGYGQGDWDLFRAAELARAAGLEVVEDSPSEEFGTPPAPRCDHAILYSGWYALHHYNDAFTWNPGAIGFHLDSESASSPREGKSWSAQALARGITVTAGAIDEPLLQGLPRPSGVMFALMQGANVGDAFLRSTLWLRWQIMNIGDPLYRPFPGGRGQFAGRRQP